MSRDSASKAKKVFGESQGVATTSQNNANSLYSSLFPTYQAEATNPQGFSAADKAAMNTAGQQSLGGAISSAAGQGGLAATRTRNAGAGDAALEESVRDGMRQNSTNALNTESQDALLKQANKQAGIEGLQGLYGSNSNELLSALGLGNNAASTENAASPGWMQNMTGLITAVAGAGKSAADLKSSGALG